MSSLGERGCIPLIVQPQANKVGSHFLSIFPYSVVCLCCKIQSDLKRCLRSQNIKSPDTMLVMEPLALSLTIPVVFTSLSKAMNVGQLKQPSINNFLQTHKSQIIFANSSPSSMAFKS
ncbi:unnamed protein product [Lactuca virosa]|uniref:Uncharacterized protein n=1 Tax=Lactuca virosa TaxID=75947 RepID=A0AAU9LZ98_9ASTR|nr:unnamed protein product [Lactuca virosa]